jgi:hypothetical protein
MRVLTANPSMATRPTKSSFSLVKPMPPDVPKMPSSIFGFGGGACRSRYMSLVSTILVYSRGKRTTSMLLRNIAGRRRVRAWTRARSNKSVCGHTDLLRRRGLGLGLAEQGHGPDGDGPGVVVVRRPQRQHGPRRAAGLRRRQRAAAVDARRHEHGLRHLCAAHRYTTHTTAEFTYHLRVRKRPRYLFLWLLLCLRGCVPSSYGTGSDACERVKLAWRRFGGGDWRAARRRIGCGRGGLTGCHVSSNSIYGCGALPVPQRDAVRATAAGTYVC